jgi:hypothetical protein
MNTCQLRFWPLAARTMVVHTVTYFLMGVLAYFALDYPTAFTRPEFACWMRPLSDPLIKAGPLFQPVRGLLFAGVLYLIRDSVFGRKRGWIVFAAVLIGLGILGTFGPAPGSLEGMIFTTIPLPRQLAGYLEVVPQATLLACGTVHWAGHPGKRRLTAAWVAAFLLIIALSLLGLLVPVAT